MWKFNHEHGDVSDKTEGKDDNQMGDTTEIWIGCDPGPGGSSDRGVFIGGNPGGRVVKGDPAKTRQSGCFFSPMI